MTENGIRGECKSNIMSENDIRGKCKSNIMSPWI